MTTPVSSDWKSLVAPYARPDVVRSLAQLGTTTVLVAITYAAAYWAGTHMLLAWIVLIPLLAGFLVRAFIIMHDCSHGSFLPWRRANEVIGCITGLLALTPFDQWRRDHAIHHASSGDLDRRGHGDVTTLTVREYLQRTPSQRLAYRLSRHPLLLLLGGPIYLLYSQRIRPRSKATGVRQVQSVLWTNAALVGLIAIALVSGGWLALAVWFLGYYFAAVIGVWLFYVQHQFEDAYWESSETWDYATSALHGSSHLRLPRILQWFTGNIGLHHVHHLSPRIPNYKLQSCHDENPPLQVAPEITIRSGIAALRLALWDEDRRRLVGFKDVAPSAAFAPAARPD